MAATATAQADRPAADPILDDETLCFKHLEYIFEEEFQAYEKQRIYRLRLDNNRRRVDEREEAKAQGKPLPCYYEQLEEELLNLEDHYAKTLDAVLKGKR